MKYVLGSFVLAVIIVVGMRATEANEELLTLMLWSALTLGVISWFFMFPQQITMIAGIFLVNRATDFMFLVGKRAFQVALGTSLGVLAYTNIVSIITK